ncbi:hypothetical protein EV651_111221 [Kribbella sp. VKM Ac-2571]|uniref:DUF6308 family protein n=1 Tax=Kribbella sp. VKM Ac-2571 TaxID=2512222 RepID=UPI00105EE946|nr:DUF6308 family protein [Kribbella sp. VKM Ac-2571]TDO57495.1 hypothetical protein EV651_111221 [Kribbella sp. VKM Ac-2571]
MTAAHTIQVGKVTIGLQTARDWVREYTDAARNETAADPYAYPAYDQYEQDTNNPRRLTDADLLAPVLLNVSVSIRTFYALGRIRDELEAGLATIDPRRPLAELNDSEIAESMQALYGVLDTDPRPHGVRATVLSKVLHRKAPQTLVLHDTWVRKCYVGAGGPVREAKVRTWVKYMTELTVAIRDDIQNQRSSLQQLEAEVPAALSHVRLLDILAWKSKGRCAD